MRTSQNTPSRHSGKWPSCKLVLTELGNNPPSIACRVFHPSAAPPRGVRPARGCRPSPEHPHQIVAQGIQVRLFPELGREGGHQPLPARARRGCAVPDRQRLRRTLPEPLALAIPDDEQGARRDSRQPLRVRLDAPSCTSPHALPGLSRPVVAPEPTPAPAWDKKRAQPSSANACCSSPVRQRANYTNQAAPGSPCERGLLPKPRPPAAGRSDACASSGIGSWRGPCVSPSSTRLPR